jgi:hypothetical protein
MSKPEDLPGEVPMVNEVSPASDLIDQDTSATVYANTPDVSPDTQPAVDLPRSEYFERMEARRLRNLKIKTLAALTGGVACSAFLVANMPIFNESPTEGAQITTEPATPELDVAQPADESAPTRRYSDVAIHYVSFDGGLPFTGDRQRVTANVQAGLRVLDNAHENTLGITDLPTMVSPDTYDLAASSVSVAEMCKPGAQPVTTSTRILNALGEQVPLKDETLDVVVFDTDESKDCGNVPIGQAVSGDVVIYKGSKLTETVVAHEVNHNEGHAHDNQYEISREDSVVNISASPYFIDRGNTQTLAGYGAYAEVVTDKDPLIGYELQRNGVIKDDQIATVEAGQSKAIQIEALTNRHADTRLVELPLAAGTISSSDKLMLELSTDNDTYTVKAYGAGTVSENDEVRGATYLIPINEDRRLNGLSSNNLDQPVTIKLATGENITFTLTQLEGVGESTRATVQVARF